MGTVKGTAWAAIRILALIIWHVGIGLFSIVIAIITGTIRGAARSQPMRSTG